MEVTALCNRLLTFSVILLDAHIQRSYTQNDGFRITTERLQLFEYDTVTFHCEALDGSTQLKVMSNNKELIHNCNIRRTSPLTCTFEVYETDSGLYWCESKRGEKSNIVNITVTAGSVILESPALPVMEGGTMTLRCRTKGTPINLLAYFYKDDILMAKSPAEEMTIINVSKSDEGIYKCSISDVGASPGSWLAVRESHSFHHGSPLVLTPLWVALTILIVALVLLAVGFLHIRKHRGMPSVVLCFSLKTTAGSHSDEDNQIATYREQSGVQYLAQGHFDMQTRGAGDQTTDHLISGRPTLPPEPQPPPDDSTADPDSLTYAVVITKQRKNTDAADNLSLKPNKNRKPQRDRGFAPSEEEESSQAVYSTLKIGSESLNPSTANNSSLAEEEHFHSHVKATESKDT